MRPSVTRPPTSIRRRDTALVDRTHLVWRLGVWGGATAMGLVFARITAVGPALRLWGNHGVHVGDLAAFAILYAWAARVTVGDGDR